MPNKVKKEFDFIGKRKYFLAVSLIIIVIGLVFNIIFGTQLDISFQGGTIFTYSYTGEIDKDQIKQIAEEKLGKEVTVDLTESLTGESQQITVSLANKEAIPTEQQDELTATLEETFADNAVQELTTQSVKASTGIGFFIKCIFAIVLGAIFITLYVGIRFRKIGGLSAGVFATLALLHDVLIAYFMYVIFRIPLNDNFIAVVLTILGYSINGTIVIYDRIRENERLYRRSKGIAEIVNTSVNQTVRRNIFTSLCTLLAVVAVAVVAMIFNLDSIISFAFPMSVGVIAGCYSSVLLSSPFWVVWREHKIRKNQEKQQHKSNSSVAKKSK